MISSKGDPVNLFEQIRKRALKLFTSRVFILTFVLVLLFGNLIRKVFSLQIIHGQEYEEEYALQIRKTKTFRGTRGNIYDSAGNLLAYNTVAYSVTIEDEGQYKDRDQKNRMLNAIILRTIDLIESNGDSVDTSSFGIEMTEKGYAFRDTGTSKLRFLADVFGYTTIDKLSNEQKNISAGDLINYLCTDDTYGYDIDTKQLDASTTLKLVNVRYRMGLNNYQKYISTSIAENVSDKTVAAIKENKVDLTGVDISEEYVRKYNDSKYFAPVIGYTGDISIEEYETLISDNKDYERTDVIGKAGLEQSLDEYLQGGKGEEELYVDNTGRILSSKQTKQASAGNDVYLTIDSDLQKAVYQLIEQKLAGILCSRLIPDLEFDPHSVNDTFKLKTPIGDVYYDLFNNEVLDMDHMWNSKAQKNEKAVAQAVDDGTSEQLKKALKIMKDPGGKVFKDLSVEMQNYLTCLVDRVLTDDAGIIIGEQIDNTDDMVKAWVKDETVNAYDYMNYVISKGWIDMTLLQPYLGKSSTYSDASQIYQAVIEYLKDNAAANHAFRKIVIKYLIREKKITGKQLCMMLYEQGVLKKTDGVYKQLASGSMKPYNFMLHEIQTLALTPGQLGTEPCSASAVVTDVKTGKVLACVSYPGYDNNRLSNIMDNKYFKRLSSMSSSPLYNKATQVRTAPGSTYKMMTAISGLGEGAITTDTHVRCTGTFWKVEPPIQCWIHPRGHGSIDVVKALTVSCNSFFNQVGYNLGLTADGTFSSSLGIQKLRKYARAFGFADKSGIELTESAPKISDTAAVPSAMGQGTNNYTTTQLVKYVQTVANSGMRYDLTLVNEVKDAKGKTIKKSEQKGKNDLKDVPEEAWAAVHKGMHKATDESKPFFVLHEDEFKMAGKTGTAQQSRVHPDHGLFVGYAPYEEPEIAMAIRITNGYSSAFAAELGCEMTRYYFKLASPKTLLHGSASTNLSSSHGD